MTERHLILLAFVLQYRHAYPVRRYAHTSRHRQAVNLAYAWFDNETPVVRTRQDDVPVRDA